MENNLDKLFKSKLEGQEPEFHPAAWDRMERLLDESGMTPVQKPKRSRRIFFILFFLGIIASGIGYMSIQSLSTVESGSTRVDNLGQSNEDLEDEILQPIKEKKQYKSIGDATPRHESKPINIRKEENNKPTNTNSNAITQASLNVSNGRKSEFEDGRTSPIQHQSQTSLSPVLTSSLSVGTTEDRTYDEYSESSVENSNHNMLPQKIESTHPSNVSGKQEAKVGSELSILDTGQKSDSEDLHLEIKIGYEALQLVPIELLSTRSHLLSSPEGLVVPQIEIQKNSPLMIGVQATLRPGRGMGYSFGPYAKYQLGSGYSLVISGQYDYQQFEAGPELSVFDKIYSFGSELQERKFHLTRQRSIRIPVVLHKQFSGFGLFAGANIGRAFISGGSASRIGETTTEDFSNVDNELLHKWNFAAQVGGSVDINRHFSIDLGLEIRSAVLVEDPSVSNNPSRYLPSLGLRYNLFKF